MPEQSGFTLWQTVTLPDRSSIAQGATITGGDLYVTQDTPYGSGQHLVINRLPADGSTPEVMRVAEGGHGDLSLDVTDGHVSFVDLDGRLWRIPFQPGKTVKLIGSPVDRGRLPIYGHDGVQLIRTQERGDRYIYWTPNRHRLFSTLNYRWIQGTAAHQGILYTLRGTPRTDSGWLYHDARVLPYVERRQALDSPRGLILEPWRVDQLGWESGAPIGGKAEPECEFVAVLDGQPHLVVGIATGHHYNASYSLMLYRKEL